MGAPGGMTALRADTFNNLQLNAGILLKNLDYSSVADATALKAAIANIISGGSSPIGVMIGATRGGGTFTVTRETRTPEIDGMRYGFKGSDFVDSADAYISTTLVEVTAANIKDLLASGTISTSGLKTTVKMNTAIAASDYLTNICWVGNISDGRLVLICLKNAINTADFTFTYTDKGEGTLAAEFHARQANVGDYDEAPFEVVVFETDGTSETLTVTSAEGTNVGATKLTTTNVLSAGQHYVYKVGTAGAAPSIGYHEEPDYTWTEWDGSSDIAVGTDANNKKMTLAVINSGNKVIKSGSVTLDVKTA